jgi:hypothetical protein
MTARFSVKNSRTEEDLSLVLKKQAPTGKDITVRLRFTTDGNTDLCCIGIFLVEPIVVEEKIADARHLVG